MTSLIPELPIGEVELPYIMAIYKFHKKKYRWISNAFGSIYVNVATLLTLSTMALLEDVKEWANTTIKGYKNFLGVETSIYWIIDSITDFTLNTPDVINNIYVADITRCFESILISGNDTLYDAMEFITRLGMSNMINKHPRNNSFGLELMIKGLQPKQYGHLLVLNMVIGFPSRSLNFCKFISG